jgi:hypothetical protein
VMEALTFGLVFVVLFAIAAFLACVAEWSR